MRPIRVDEGEPFLVRDCASKARSRCRRPRSSGKPGCRAVKCSRSSRWNRRASPSTRATARSGSTASRVTLQSGIVADAPKWPTCRSGGRRAAAAASRHRHDGGRAHAAISRQPGVEARYWASRWTSRRGTRRAGACMRPARSDPWTSSARSSRNPAASRRPRPAPAEPVRALVTVQEWPRFRFRYGIELNDTAQSSSDDPSDILPTFEQGGRAFSLGATTDFAARNLFGRAVTAGVAARYTLDFRAARTYATMPTFLGRRITSTCGSSSRTKNRGHRVRDPSGLQHRRHHVHLRAAHPAAQESRGPVRYTLERNHTFDLHPVPSIRFRSTSR